MRIIVKRPGRFRGLKRPRKDLMKRAAAFNSPRAAKPSRRRIGCPFPGNWTVGHVGFDPDARDRMSLAVTLYPTRGIITQT